MAEIIELEKSDEDIDGFNFAIRAMVGKPDQHVAMHNCVKIENGWVTGTDGRRIHAWQHHGTYKPGLYRVLKKLKTHVVLMKEDPSAYPKAPFPEIEDSMFEHDIGPGSNQPVTFLSANCMNSDHAVIPVLCKIIRTQRSFHGINPGFLKDLDDVFNVEMVPGDDRTIFRCNRKRAVISAYNLED